MTRDDDMCCHNFVLRLLDDSAHHHNLVQYACSVLHQFCILNTKCRS